jgi:hypothetical protein
VKELSDIAALAMVIVKEGFAEPEALGVSGVLGVAGSLEGSAL